MMRAVLREDDRLLNRNVARLVLIAAVAGLIAPMSVSAFEYAGFGFTTDPFALRDQFPESQHEFWQRGTGSIVSPDDPEGRFMQLLREGSGRYVVRLSPDDTRGEVTHVSFSLEKGKVLRMTLSFEREGEGMRPELVERRFPLCRSVAGSLVDRYGKPTKQVTRMEEGLEHRLQQWSSGAGTVTLDCGRYPKRKIVFASDLEFEPAGSPIR